MFNSLSLPGIILLVAVVLVGMVIHETAHAYMGLLLGDETAAEAGRVSLNPLRHIDPIMTLLLPLVTIVLFRVPIMAARPVPFNPERVRFGDFGAALIAAAGPLANLLLAVLGAILLRATVTNTALATILYVFVSLNVALFIFNLLPIPPLDGSRVLYAFAPEALQQLMRQIEPMGLFLIIGLVLLGGFGGFLVNLNQFVLNLLI